MKFPNLTLSHTSCFIFCLASCFLALQPVYAQQPGLDDILDLGLEDLLSMEVTSVSKKKQRLTESAAAIYVITQEDIRRSGVTSIAEALRMAPGIQVAKMDSNKWAVSSRGFNGQFANKLLILIDGRSVYTPSYSGVYWDVQDTMLEDIERIEVIRGPGATIWGANAVNGVINIITRSASETKGGLLVARLGDEEKSQLSMRYGFSAGEGADGRVYFKASEHDSSYATELEGDAGDDWSSYQSGFRLELPVSSSDRLTLQGDVYRNDENQRVGNLWLDPTDPANSPPYQALNTPDQIDANGYNLLTRWEHNVNNDLSTSLQLYYDHTERNQIYLDQINDTLDIDFTQRYSGWKSHDLIWGLGYRQIEAEFGNSYNVQLLPASQSSTLVSAFIQDEITLKPDSLRLTVGVKVEDNDHTGVETQPSARLVWLASTNQTLWASVSQAARTPSQVENSGRVVTNIFSNPFAPAGTPASVIYIDGSDDFDAEKLNAFEIGYRVQPSERLSLDIALFHNQYKNLSTFEATSILSITNPFAPAAPLLIPSGFLIENKRDATSQGIELSGDWHATESWRLQFNYSVLSITAENDVDSNDTFTTSTVEGSAPVHQWSLRSSHTLSDAWALDMWLYHYGKLDNTSFSSPIKIPAYGSFNTRISWQIKQNITFSMVAQNLLADHHKEFSGEFFVTRAEVERSLYAQLRVDF